MPPKRTSARHSSKPAPTSLSKRTQSKVQKPPATSKAKSRVASSTSSKRGAPSTISTSTAKSAKRVEAAPLQPPSDPVKTINFLLSKDAYRLTVHEDEFEGAKTLRSYTSAIPLTPFEELLCAVILSRPISHRLGQRSIRTILNPEYNFTTPKAILDAGPERVHQALEVARTQHKAKTAEQIGLLAASVKDQFADHARDQQLSRLKDEAGGDEDTLRDMVTSNVKGAGNTAMNIFLRRIQAAWSDYYPFMDERTTLSLEKLGLPKDANKLSKLVEDSWSDMDISHIEGTDNEEKRRRAYVLVLERATGASLEGKLNEVIELIENA